MNKKIRIILGVVLVPVGAFLLSACGQDYRNNEQEVVLEETRDNWIDPWGLEDDGYLGEWGHCNDAWDNDGDGLADMADPACHLFGPLRDLSLFDFPAGHNYFPDITMDIPGGPGYDGWFRNPDQIADWLRFLTEPDGNVAGIDLYTPGVNPEVVPLPAPIPGAPVPQGTWHQGNNNNLSLPDLHWMYLDHDFLPLAGDVAPDVDGVYWPEYVPTARGIPGGFPGMFYRSPGPWGGNGSQGALRAADTGNPDADAGFRGDPGRD